MVKYNITITAEDPEMVGMILETLSHLISIGYKEGMAIGRENIDGSYAFKSEEKNDE